MKLNRSVAVLLQEDAYSELQRTLMYSILDSSLSVLNCSPRGRDVATGEGLYGVEHPQYLFLLN